MLTERMSSLALLVLALTVTLVAALPQGRLLESEDAKVGEYPWVVSVRLNQMHVCSGSIISTTKILTAGHCVSDVGTKPVALSQLSVRVGSINVFGGGSLVKVTAAEIHPSYGNFLHDIAVLTVDPLTFSDKINKIDLPVKSAEGPEAPEDGTPVYLTGWGEQGNGTSKFLLQKTSFNTMSPHMCELSCGYGYTSTLCLARAEHQGVCRGDEGAGVFTDNKELVAVVSFFFGSCGTKYPDISSYVPYYLDWLDSKMQ